MSAPKCCMSSVSPWWRVQSPLQPSVGATTSDTVTRRTEQNDESWLCAGDCSGAPGVD